MWAAADDRHDQRYLKALIEILLYDQGCALAFSDYVTRNLETGEESFYRVIPSNSNNLFINYVIRLLQMCPSMVYGLFRTQYLKSTKLEAFDFSDVHLTLHLACQFRIRVANECLYVAGTKGARIQYSFSGGKIRRIDFLRRQYSLVLHHFDPFRAGLLFLLACIVMLFNKITS